MTSWSDDAKTKPAMTQKILLDFCSKYWVAKLGFAIVESRFQKKPCFEPFFLARKNLRNLFY